MKTYQAKRVEITIEGVMERRLTDALDQAGVRGYTVLPVKGGSGQSGQWSREGEISRAAGMVVVACIVLPERLDALLELASGLLQRHIGVISVSDCEVLRPQRF